VRTRKKDILFMSVPSAGTITTEQSNALATDQMRVVTTYIPGAWTRALEECGLSQKYPFLVHDISFGSPIGNPPPLTYTFIPENMPSALEHPLVIEAFLDEERAAGRVSGPYTIEEAFVFFGGHFRTAPMGLVEKEPGSSKWRMIRNLSAEDCFGTSTNGWLDAADDPITWYTCAAMADIVSVFIHSFHLSGSRVSRSALAVHR
jgi:hypothetical protein